jgi:hypothetical protein
MDGITLNELTWHAKNKPEQTKWRYDIYLQALLGDGVHGLL